MRFIIRQDQHMPLGRLLEYLNTETKRCPQSVEVKDYESTRRVEANAYYWGPVVSQIVKHLHEHCGQPTTAEVLHEQHKRLFMPVIGWFDTTIEVNGCKVPWTQTVHQSTTKCSVRKFSEFIEAVTAHWAEQGVQFVDRRYE